MKDEKIERLPASELERLLSKFFLNARKKNGEEYEPATVSSFQRCIQRYLSEKKYPFNILKDNEFEKSRKVLAAKRKSLVHEHGKRKQTASCSSYRRRWSPFWSRRIWRLQPSCASKNCVVVFIPTLRFPSKRRVVSHAGVTFSFNSRMMAKKSWFGWPSEAQRPDMVRREDTKECSNQRFLPPIPQSPASGNEGTRITRIIHDQMKKFGIWRPPSEKMK